MTHLDIPVECSTGPMQVDSPTDVQSNEVPEAVVQSGTSVNTIEEPVEVDAESTGEFDPEDAVTEPVQPDASSVSQDMQTNPIGVPLPSLSPAPVSTPQVVPTTTPDVITPTIPATPEVDNASLSSIKDLTQAEVQYPSGAAEEISDGEYDPEESIEVVKGAPMETEAVLQIEQVNEIPLSTMAVQIVDEQPAAKQNEGYWNNQTLQQLCQSSVVVGGMEFENENLPEPGVPSDSYFDDREVLEESVMTRPSLETSIKKKDPEELNVPVNRPIEERVSPVVQNSLDVTMAIPVTKNPQEPFVIDLDPAYISEEEEVEMPSRLLMEGIICRKRLFWRMSSEEIVFIGVWRVFVNYEDATDVYIVNKGPMYNITTNRM